MSVLPPRSNQLIRFPVDARPQLIISIDAEEEFDWSKQATRGPHAVESMEFLWRAQTIFERYGARPTYMLDYPVAADEEISKRIADLCADGRCDIGTHLHPWTNPPHEEALSTFTSFPGNLPKELERAKLSTLTDLIETKVGRRPVIYRAGRYGFGARTAEILRELGYKIDMSVIPMRDYSGLGGPDFSRLSATPYWFGPDQELLEIPLTAGYSGALRLLGSNVAAMLNVPLMRRVHVPGILARLGVLSRIYITPEGMPVDEAKRLTRSLLNDGHRVFTLHYHSPSLEPGNTPYVKSQGDLESFLSWLEIYLDFFLTELGGVTTTPLRVYDWAKSLLTAPMQAPTSPVTTARAVPGISTPVRENQTRSNQGARCLIVATNFPPVRGGSAVVYENLCKSAERSIVVLTAWRSYATGEEVAGWRQHDRASPFSIYRLELLRPRVTHSPWLTANIASVIVNDLPLMLRVFGEVRRIVHKHKIGVICIGELVYGGWLVLACRYLLGCKVIQYVHGEEITVNGTSRSERMKRVYLRLSDAIIAVSRFTRNALLQEMSVEPAKIALIENGVDVDRFYEKPRPLPLIDRHHLQGKRVILSVGRLVERKGFDKMLMAMPRVLQRHPDVHYVVVGEGPYHGELERIAQEFGVAEHVTFVGRVSDDELVDYYALCDVFALPNREMPDGDTEGFGLVYLEANACGKPVISGLAGGVLDAVQDGVNGLTVDGTDPEGIAEVTLRILDDDTLHAKLRAGAISMARQSSWARRSEQFALLCDRLMDQPS